jgi:hypothetical protein
MTGSAHHGIALGWRRAGRLARCARRVTLRTALIDMLRV